MAEYEATALLLETRKKSRQVLPSLALGVKNDLSKNIPIYPLLLQRLNISRRELAQYYEGNFYLVEDLIEVKDDEKKT